MRSLIQAVHDKYDDDDEDVSSSELVMFVHVPRTTRRQRLPSVLVLDHCNIDSVGDEESLSSTCSDVRELDLSNNQISGWKEVIKLINCLPKLSFLNLSNNILGGSLIDSPSFTSFFPSLTTLILNRVGMEWDNLVPYLGYIPNLEALHLSLNEMKTPSDNTEIKFPKVTTLHYDGNCVEHRDHLSWISQNFPSLKSLVLCDCPLWTLRWNSSTQKIIQVQEIQSNGSSSESGSEGSQIFPHCDGDGQSNCCYRLPDDHSTPDVLFPNLHSISLNNCIIDCWEELDQLRQFPSLLELRLQSCPLFQVQVLQITIKFVVQVAEQV
uniref:EOG090X05JJ n=1 Tax=Evadne anonyx TaxID=141404 RepID=A0A9N6WTG5_9CRUS|nr:EOG090X05JJ [Evadne anonyx]